jgi:hypothetical protein
MLLVLAPLAKSMSMNPGVVPEAVGFVATAFELLR